MVAGTGRLNWVEDSGLSFPRFDGYSVWMEEPLSKQFALGDAATVSAWLAIESYPVATASVIEWGDAESGVRLGIDRLGFVVLSVVGVSLQSDQPIALGRWLHVAGSYSRSGELRLYLDGLKAKAFRVPASGAALKPIAKVWIGRAAKDETVAKVFETNVLNGLIRSVRVYGSSLSQEEIASLAQEGKPHTAALATDAAWFLEDAQRPRYHAMPPRAWTNEPHGLVHWRGQYHLFYQKNPNGPYWGHIHWGHMTSPDLWHWTEQPMALVPSIGPDSEGCWSGSAIVSDDRLVLIYTGGDGKRASICMASSEDGIRFTKHPGNPVIEAPPVGIGVKEFRDPFVWKQGNEYRMIIGSGIEGQGGTALLYRSVDLVHWSYLKPILIGDKCSSGVFWEMPVFVPIGEHHVLIVCEVPGRASYWVGRWSDEDDAFTPVTAEPKRLDLFNHFLSPTPLRGGEGRVLTMGIVPETRASVEQWQAGWAHLYGLPRELSLDSELRLRQMPTAETLRRFTPLVKLDRAANLTSEWTVIATGGSSILLTTCLERGSSASVAMALRRSPDRQEETLLRYDWSAERLTLDRTRSSLNPHTQRNLQQVSYTPLTAGVLELTIFIDQSVLEVFVDGVACFTSRVYPALAESVGVALNAEGGVGSLVSLCLSGLSV